MIGLILIEGDVGHDDIFKPFISLKEDKHTCLRAYREVLLMVQRHDRSSFKMEKYKKK